MRDFTPSDPRPFWRLVTKIRRLLARLPRWLLPVVAIIGNSLAHLLYRTIVYPEFVKDSPVYRGIRIWATGSNAELYRQRVEAALDLLATYAPVYLRWLRNGFDTIQVAQLDRIMHKWATPDYKTRLLSIHPQSVWKASTNVLAVSLVSCATYARLYKRAKASKIGRSYGRSGRLGRMALREMLACAHLLPNTEKLVANLASQVTQSVQTDLFSPSGSTTR